MNMNVTWFLNLLQRQQKSARLGEKRERERVCEFALCEQRRMIYIVQTVLICGVFTTFGFVFYLDTKKASKRKAPDR